MTTKIELSTLTSAQLVAVYNELTQGSLTKFSDKETAVRRVGAALDEKNYVLVTGLPEGIVVHAHYTTGNFSMITAPAQTKEPSSKKSSARATFGEHEVIEHNAGAHKAEDGSLVLVNPKRKGTKAHARFQIIVDRVSLTVGEYLDACVALEGPDAEERFKYRRDLTWDIEHGHITFPNGAEG